MHSKGAHFRNVSRFQLRIVNILSRYVRMCMYATFVRKRKLQGKLKFREQKHHRYGFEQL